MNKVYVVGIGPGGADQITPQARAAMDRAEVLCGYPVYIDLMRPLYPDKEVFTTPMTREAERCRRAGQSVRSFRRWRWRWSPASPPPSPAARRWGRR